MWQAPRTIHAEVAQIAREESGGLLTVLHCPE
jgi:hypothetical protein